MPFKQIGKVTPCSAHEITSSDWSLGCETLDRDMAEKAWAQEEREARFRAIPVYDCPVLIAEKSAFLFQ